MNIESIKKEPAGIIVGFNAVVVGKLMPKNGGGNYLSIICQDKTGTLEFPVFENVESRAEKLKDPVACHVKGSVKIWNDNHQINNPSFVLLDEDEIKSCDFLPSYDETQIDNAKNHLKYFINSILNDQDREMVVNLIGNPNTCDELYNKFCTAPSAQKHHGNKLGGLLLHTVGVALNLETIIANYSKNDSTIYNGESVLNLSRLIMLALIHDAEKMNEYEYSLVIRRKPNKRLGHIEETVAKIYEVNNKMDNPYSEEELDEIAYSVLSHHGQFGKYEPKSLNDWLLHLADMTDATIVGEIEK